MEAQSFIVYVLRTSKNTLYIGQTNNLKKRMQEHTLGKRGAKYMRAFHSFQLVHTEEFGSRSEAMKREVELKKLTKLQKEKLIILAGSATSTTTSSTATAGKST